MHVLRQTRCQLGDIVVAVETRLLLVRHAQAECNAADVFAGHGRCTGLTAAGREHCAAIAARLRELSAGEVVVLVSSAMRRAVETAGLLAEALGVGGEIPARCGLCERHPGSLDGISNADFRALTAAGTVPPDVELPAAFLLRARRELRGLAGRYAGRTVVAVTHSGVVGASFWACGGLSGRLPFRIRPANGSITEWSLRDGAEGGWLLGRYNDLG
jgi:2,3-bisphosphoglycerate-dependent phosphoglycerate mutase